MFEGRNKLPAVLDLGKFGMGTIEPTAHICLAKFAGSHARDKSFAKSCSPQGRIVNDHWNAVAGQTNVQLNTGSAILEGFPESRQRIFRSQSGSAAVPDYQWRGF